MVKTTKEKIITAASKDFGDFVNTDGDWCLTRTPEQFKTFLEKSFGFSVIECKATANSTAVAITDDGIKIAWNGYCMMA